VAGDDRGPASGDRVGAQPERGHRRRSAGRTFKGVVIRPAAPDEGEPAARSAPAGDEDIGYAAWYADPVARAVKFVFAAVFLLLTLVVATNAAGRLLGGIFAAGCLVWALRDAVWPLRLAVDREGVTVSVGFRGYRDIPWSEVERVRLDPQRRLAGRLLEIDTGGSLHFFGRFDLGEPPADALDTITQIRPRH